MTKLMSHSSVSPSSANPVSSKSVSPTSFASSRATIPTRQAIALISYQSDPAAEIGKEETGGQTVYVRQVGEALAKLGWQVDLFTRKSHAEDPKIVQHSAHCRTIRLTAGPETFIPRDALFEYLPEFVEAFRKFQTKEGSHYPLIHTNYWMSAWVGLQLKQQSNVQLVHTYHSVGAVKYSGMAQQPAIAQTRLEVERQILEDADRVVATSPQEAEQLRAFVSTQGTVDVIPCGTDLSTFHVMPRGEARSQLGFSTDEQVVLYVGRFDPCKGIETLVQAVAQLKAANRPQPLRLVIVGGSEPERLDGQERSRLEALVQELGLADCTQFVGAVGHDRLPLYYTAADVCVIPSHYEPFGLVAIEAMACGTPVVASDVGGLRFTVVPGETGCLVPPKDVEGFATAIDHILGDALWSRKMRKQASLRVQQNFSWTGAAIQLSDLYRRLLAQSLMGPTPAQNLSAEVTPIPPALTVQSLGKAS